MRVPLRKLPSSPIHFLYYSKLRNTAGCPPKAGLRLFLPRRRKLITLAHEGDASECIGDKGTFNVPSNSTHVFCAGNNNGTFWWKDTANGTSGSHAFSYDHS
jgi:hypothetical protein